MRILFIAALTLAGCASAETDKPVAENVPCVTVVQSDAGVSVDAAMPVVDAALPAVDAGVDAPVRNPLTLISFDPTMMPRTGGIMLKLYGTGFLGVETVEVMLYQVPFTVESDTEIRIIAPSMAELDNYPAMIDVRVTRKNDMPAQAYVIYQ